MANKKKSSSKKKTSKKTSAKKPEDLTPDELTDKAMAEAEEQDPAKEKVATPEPRPRSGLAKEPMVIVSGKGIGRKKMPLSEYRKLQEKRNAGS